MKDIIKFLIFLIYTITVFFIKDYYILGVLVSLQILLIIILKINIEEAVKNILNLSPFILFTIVINIFASNLKEAILIGVRLILVCNITYIFSKVLTILQIAVVIQKLLIPLKVFKIDTKNIAIMISIAISFIPIIKQELISIKYSLIVKGFDCRVINQIKHLNYIMDPLFISLIKKINTIEYALKAKAYIE